jgi:hypothetical protein
MYTLEWLANLIRSPAFNIPVIPSTARLVAPIAAFALADKVPVAVPLLVDTSGRTMVKVSAIPL